MINVATSQSAVTSTIYGRLETNNVLAAHVGPHFNKEMINQGGPDT